MLRVVLAAVARSAGMSIEMMIACSERGEVQVGRGWCVCAHTHTMENELFFLFQLDVYKTF